jgi:hypothetical protein
MDATPQLCTKSHNPSPKPTLRLETLPTFTDKDFDLPAFHAQGFDDLSGTDVLVKCSPRTITVTRASADPTMPTMTK